MKHQILLSLTMAIGAALPGATTAAELFPAEYKAFDDRPIIVVDQRHEMIATLASTPLLRIFADGLILVHRSKPLRSPGDYQMRVSDDTLKRLINTLDSYGLMTFDVEYVKRQKSAAQAKQHLDKQTMHAVSDSTDTYITFSFRSYRGSELQRSLTWSNAGLDARLHPQITALNGLAAAEQELLALAWHPELQRVAVTSKPSGEE